MNLILALDCTVTQNLGTTTADGIKLTISLPGETSLGNIELDVQEETVIVSTPNFLLKEQLSRPVDPKTAKGTGFGNR